MVWIDVVVNYKYSYETKIVVRKVNCKYLN